MMPFAIGCIALTVAVLGLPSSALSGVGPTFWFDDFDDMDAQDGNPLEWTFNPPTAAGSIFPGEYNATSGDLYLQGHDLPGQLFDADDEVLIASVETHTFTDGVSVRAVGEVNPFAAIGVLANGTTFTLQTYYALHHVEGVDDGAGNPVLDDMGNPVLDGGVEFESIDLINQVRVEFLDEGGFTAIAAPDKVVVQLDIFDGVLTYRHWKAGDPQGTAVVVSAEDTVFTSGVAGIVFNEDEVGGLLEGSALVKHAKASSVRLVDGDMDLDGDVDFDDIDDFVLGLNDPAGYEAANGLPPFMMGDTDNDGDQDFDDIPVFVSILTGGAVQGVPEPSTLLLSVVGLVGLLALRRKK
jgi:hypothetical protein